ncbi:cell division FtsA domain-containing protein [Clostridiaceae bacterium 35-E11]
MTESTRSKINPHEVIFSLDIGTRSVIGIVGKKEGNRFVIVETEMMEHPDRAMYDGQIHDIEKVAAVAKKIKEKLEERLGFSLSHVAIAAAGRALKTYRIQASREIDITKTIDKAIIRSMEIEGIQEAQEALNQEMNDQNMKYYCVGYTVVNYYLDEGMITSLQGHKGSKIGADLLATFLPHVVVDSLYSVMYKIGLEVLHLTLEPIAAIEVAIPQKARLLNLALIDIGAGTSDIALTKDGAVVAYAMASVAGDEITEAIAKEFLMDFDAAEKLKLQLNKKDSHTFQDIVGISYSMTTEEIIEKIAPVIENLAAEIADKIVQYNAKAPSAIFCIGGGSQIPRFTFYLAEKLGLKEERVVVRGTEIIQDIEFQCAKLEGPEFITPIGIGLVSARDHEKNFMQVIVNKELVKLFKTKEMFISDALIRAGLNAKKLIGRKGKKLHFTVNKQPKVVKGDYGEAAKIYLNGKPSNLDTPIKDMDEIRIDFAVDGKDAHLTIKEFIETLPTVNFNGLEIKLIDNLLVNGKPADSDYLIKEEDQITFGEIHNVEELLERLDIDPTISHVYVNGIEADKTYILKHMDEIVTCERKRLPEVALPTDSKSAGTIKIKVNDKILEIPLNEKPPIFVDIFNHFDFDRTKVKGNLIMKLNGRKVNYTDEIKDGDRVEIYWEK